MLHTAKAPGVLIIHRYPDKELPATGMPSSVEKALCPVFIEWPEHDYATRAQTIVLLDHDNNLVFVERARDSLEDSWRTTQQSFQL